MRFSNLNPSEKLVYDASVLFLKELGLPAGEASINTNGVDWSAVLNFLRVHKLFPTLYPTIAQYVPTDHRKTFADLYEAHVRSTDEVMEELIRIWPLIEARDSGASIAKCFVLADMLYGSIYRRYFGDIDILTNEEDIEALGNLLIREGYEPKRNTGSAEVPYHPSFWEVEFGKRLSSNAVIHIEFKRKHSSFADAHTGFFRDSVRHVDFKGMRMLTVDFLGSCVLTIYSAYKNSDCMGKYAMQDFVKLREYVDLAALVLRYGKTIDQAGFIRILESLNYGYQAMVAMKDLCSLYPALADDGFVSSIMSKKWLSPEYSLYFPDVRWRSDIMHRVTKREEARAEFLELLMLKWFDAGRECFALSRELPLFRKRVNLVGADGAIDLQLDFSESNRLSVEVEIPDSILNQYRCRFTLYIVLEGGKLTLPPSEGIEIHPENQTACRSRPGVSRTFRAEMETRKLLKENRGAVRVCVSPVLARYLPNGTTKDLTEDHYWTMPPLLELCGT